MQHHGAILRCTCCCRPCLSSTADRLSSSPGTVKVMPSCMYERRSHMLDTRAYTSMCLQNSAHVQHACGCALACCLCAPVVMICVRVPACIACVHLWLQAAMYSACTTAKLQKSHWLDNKMPMSTYHNFWPKNQTRSEHLLRAWDLPSLQESFEIIIGMF